MATANAWALTPIPANDYEQAASRVFQAAARIIEASLLLRGRAKVKANRIDIRATGTFIQACASDYSGFAGANPTLTICDELWGFVHEASRQLFDEAVPSPARQVLKLFGRSPAACAGVLIGPSPTPDLRGSPRETGGSRMSAQSEYFFQFVKGPLA